MLPTQRINLAQAFRIIPVRSELVFSEGAFYRPKIRLETILDDIYAIPKLENAVSEKGKKTGSIHFGNRATWRTQTVFGMFEAICEAVDHRQSLTSWGELGKQLGAFPIIVCDDDNEETCDFIAADLQNRRVAFIHAKAGGKGNINYNVGALQEVGRQALASLAFLARGNGPSSWTDSRWQSEVKANDRTLPGRGRVFRNAGKLSFSEINDALSTSCLNNSFERQVWIVVGNLLRRSALEKAIRDDPEGRRLRQLLMHIDAMRTACARANVRMRIFCH